MCHALAAYSLSGCRKAEMFSSINDLVTGADSVNILEGFRSKHHYLPKSHLEHLLPFPCEAKEHLPSLERVY